MGNTGHCWAVIDGTVMDTTAYQDGYGWTSPKVNYAGSPSFKGGSGSSDNPTYKIEFKEGAFVYQASDGTLKEIPEPMRNEIKQMIQEGVSKGLHNL